MSFLVLPHFLYTIFSSVFPLGTIGEVEQLEGQVNKQLGMQDKLARKVNKLQTERDDVTTKLSATTAQYQSLNVSFIRINRYESVIV